MSGSPRTNMQTAAATPATAAQPYTAAQYRKNFLIHLLERIFMQFGEDLLVYSQEVLIGLFRGLGAGADLIGVAFGATKLNYLIQALTARWVESLPQKKRFVVWSGLVYRLPFLAIPLTLWLFGTNHPLVALVVAIGGLWLHWVLNSIMNPPMMDLYGDTVPNRSRFFSYKVVAGAIIGTVAAFAVKWLFGILPFPMRYTVLFSIALVFVTISWVLLTQVLDNPMKPVPERCSSPLLGYLLSTAKLIPKDKTLAVFLGGRITNEICFSWLFVVTLEYLRRFDLGDAALGNVMFFRFVPAIVVAFLAGRMSERFGARRSLVVGATALVFMWVLATVVSSPGIYLVVFLLMTTHLSIWSACEPDAILLISPADSRVAYLTVIMVIPNTIGAVTAPLGGLLVDRFSSYPLFMMATAISVVSLGFYILLEFMRVPESSVEPEIA